MPVDTRRLPVPDDTKSPYDFVEDVSKENDLTSRKDERQPSQSRPIFIKAGVVSQAKGSAYIELDKTKVICAVYGPREVTKREEFSMTGQLYCELKYATFARRSRGTHQQGSQEKGLSLIVRQALEPAVCLDKFPKARMDVFITVLEDDGSALAAALSCASVALASGGIEMYDIVVGCSVRQYGALCLLDPTGDEEYKPKLSEVIENNGSVTVGFLPSIHQVSALVQNGKMDIVKAQEAIKFCVETCQRIYPLLQKCLARHVKQQMKDGL